MNFSVISFYIIQFWQFNHFLNVKDDINQSPLKYWIEFQFTLRKIGTLIKTSYFIILIIHNKSITGLYTQ